MRKTTPRTYLIALALIVAGIVCLAVTGLKAGSAYFNTVAEALEVSGQDPVAMKIFGTVSPLGPTALGAGIRFSLLDEKNTDLSIEVMYAGALPPLFKPGAEIIADGAYNPAQRIFTAHELITKCPSRYRKENRNP